MKLLQFITSPYRVVAILLLLASCTPEKNQVTPQSNKVLLLKVDYLTNQFEGGTETSYTTDTPAFTIKVDYIEPLDFGNIKLSYQELNETLFDGSMIWMGTGIISYPDSILPASTFTRVLTNDYISPDSGFVNLFNPQNIPYNYSQVWTSVQSLVKVREYLASNPYSPVKLFLYTPSTGPGNPAEWDWIIFMKN